MAESVVEFSLKKLSSILSQEISLLGGLRNEFQQIKLELDSMKSFLRDADRKKEIDTSVKTWVEQVREVAYDVEDIIDEFFFTHQFDREPRNKFMGSLRNAVRFPNGIFIKHQIANRLQQIKRDVHAISARRIRYGLPLIEEQEGTSSYDHRDVCLDLEDENVVGMKKKVDLLVDWLRDDEPRRMVISVVGMGGLGKTTLVAKAYKNQMVRSHFDCFAWVSVSQSYRIEGLLRGMIKELYKAMDEALPCDMGGMNARQLKDMVIEYLQLKRYLIVLDDVWSINAWCAISTALPNNRCCSRIMLTTRRMDVASGLSDGSRDFQLKPLNKEEGWELFCKKAFWKEPCPPELKPLAQNFVEKCEGLPLAIVAMSGLLASKDKTLLTWENIYNSLRWQLSNNDMLKSISSILLLSFNDLPYYLKACFLYCSIFPEDHLIHRKRLIRLWVAEGFVEEREGMMMEDAAEDYLMQLIHRSMIQLVETNDFGRIRTCRVHDLMRDLALSKCREEKFSMVFNGQEANQDGNVRRLSICKSGENLQSRTGMTMPHLRSFFVFDENIPLSFSFPKIVSCFKLLRVLDLKGIPIESISDELTDSFNLRYLNLTNTKVKELPKSLGRLKNLQVLDVRNTQVKTLPKGIVKLQKLRHLFFYRVHTGYHESFNRFSGIQVPNGLCYFNELCTLDNIEANEEIIKQVGHLKQLRRLGIHKLKAVNGEELCNSIRKMENLLCLTVRTINEEELLQMETLSPPPHYLQKIRLCGRLEKLPHWFGSLTNLAYLLLHWSRLNEDPLSPLQALPNLVALKLFKAYDGKQLSFHAGWFPKLKKLSLHTLTQLNQVRIEKGAMPSIREIFLHRCSELKMVPEGTENLTTLLVLYLQEMPDELVERLRGDGGEDRPKVQHIPNIKHEYQKEGAWIVERFS